MLDYFTSKKGKKPQVATKERDDSPILSPKDEQFLEQIVADDRAVPELETESELREAGDATDNPAQLVNRKGRHGDEESERSMGKEHHHHSHKSKNRWSFLDRFNSKKVRHLISV